MILTYVTEGFVIKRSSASIEWIKDRKDFLHNINLCMCNIPISHNQVIGDRLGLPEWPRASTSFCCIHVCKAELKPELHSLCNYTSVGLQGHFVTLRGLISVFACCLKLLNLFLGKTFRGWGVNRLCNCILFIVHQFTLFEGRFAHSCSR